MSDQDNKGKVNSTKLVEHVQFVHFSIVVTSIALIAVLSLNQNEKITEALRQLKEVERVVDKWGETYKITADDVVNANIRSSHYSISDEYRLYFNFDKEKNIAVKIDDNNILLRLPTDRYFWSKVRIVNDLQKQNFERAKNDVRSELPDNILNIKRPANIGEFIKTWNDLSEPLNLVQFIKINKNVYYSKKTSGSNYTDMTPLPWFTAYESDNYPQIYLLTPKPKDGTDQELSDGFKNTSFIFSNEDDSTANFHFKIEVNFKATSYFALNELINRSQVKWVQKPFSEVAPQLNEFAKDYSDISIKDFRKVLEERKLSSEKDFSVFGVSIPAQGLRQWGVVAIVILQVYLTLHFWMLSNRISNDDPGLEVPWIGIYPNNTTATVTCITAAALPIMSVLFANIYSSTSLGLLYYLSANVKDIIFWSGIFNLCLIVISIGLSIGTYVIYINLWHKIKAIYAMEEGFLPLQSDQK